MNIATITAAAAPATTPAQAPAASAVAVITQTPPLTGLFRGRRSCARAGFGGWDRSDHVGMPAVTAAAGLVRRAHTGSVHLYLAYGALGVLIVLVVAR